MELNITKEQARRFLLLKHALLGDYKYFESKDIIKFVESVGCIQYDPVDVVGKNAELVLNSRFKDFKKEFLYEELYKKRNLIDYWGKNMSIILRDDFKYFTRTKNKFKANIRGIEEVNKLAPIVLGELEKADYLSSKDIEISGKMDWYWFNSRKSKAVLEALFYQGRVMIHHRRNTNRYFSLPEKLFNEEVINDYEFDTEFDYYRFRIIRRIKGVGLLAPKGSYAYIAIDGLNQKLKTQIYSNLYETNQIVKVNIEGFKVPYYFHIDDLDYMNKAMSDLEFKERLEFIAPLDSLLWDREFIKDLFDFDYTWEIYFPKEKRVYGYYVLPILYGNDFIGRLEAIANRKEKVLEVNNIYLESNVKKTKELKKKMSESLDRLMSFNELNSVEFLNEEWII